MLPFLKEIENFMRSIEENTGTRSSPYPVFFIGLLLLFIAFIFMTDTASYAVSLALFLAPLWLPFLLVGSAWILWIIWRQSDFIASQSYILLEIKPPRNVVKTPLAMETFFSGMHHSPGEATWHKKFILGSVRPWWSLEMASIEGSVHFFIWTRIAFRRIVESQLYAQYPGVQIVEAKDYTRQISATPEDWAIWGCEYTHTKEDPLPIKSYVDYGLDKVQKEPEQVDPLANVIEFMGSLGKGEQFWLQMLIRVHKGEKYKKGIQIEDPKTKQKVTKYPKNWKEYGELLVGNIRAKTREPYIDPATGKEIPGFPNPTKGQMEMIAAIERNTAKLGFDVGIRAIYFAKPDRFQVNAITSTIGLFKNFTSEGWNGIRATRWMMIFNDYPWEIGVDKLKDQFRRWLVEAFRRRSYFHEPFKQDGMVMSTEELATIYHIPSSSVSTPSLERIKSTTGEAPANLPL